MYKHILRPWVKHTLPNPIVPVKVGTISILMKQLKLRPREIKWLAQVSIAQQSLIILAPGTSFMDITFPRTGVGGMVSGWVKGITFTVHFIWFCGNLRIFCFDFSIRVTFLWDSNGMVDLTGDRAHAVIRVTGNGCEHRWSFTCSLAAYLPLCVLSTGPCPWGLRTPDIADHWWHWHLITITFSCTVVSDSLQPHGL